MTESVKTLLAKRSTLVIDKLWAHIEKRMCVTEEDELTALDTIAWLEGEIAALDAELERRMEADK